MASIFLLAGLGASGHIWLAMGIVALIAAIATIAFQTLVKKGHQSAKKLTEKLAESVSEAEPDLRDNLAKPTVPETATADPLHTQA